ARPLDERDWTDPDSPGLTPYARSKTIAEQAAWALVRERGEGDRLSVVNPGAIIGPVLSDDLSYSLQAVQRLLAGMPGMPRLGFSLVAVRDVADLEIRAMTAPDAGGERFIAATRFLWMSEIGSVLREASGSRPRRCLPATFRTSWCGAWPSSTPAFAPSSADSGNAPSCRRRR